jgi:hypothetical protein
MASKKSRKISMLLAAVSLVAAGYVTNGYTQDQAEILNPSAQRSPTTINPGPSLRAQRIGASIVADVSVDPVAHSGACPATFNFKGIISVNRPATVYYRFVRSDNYRSQPVPLVFDKPGTQEVTHSWQVPGEIGKTLEGWAALQVVNPLKFQSNPAYFKNTCTDEPKSSPPGPQAAPPPEQERSAK